MSRARLWLQGARPKTLGASIAPVLVGSAAAHRSIAWRFGAALVVGLGMQVGVNLANDVADGVRGVDSPSRRGPVRLVASGAASPRTVTFAAGISFAIAALAGAALALSVSLWLFLLGAACVLAAVSYSSGPAYGARGLGELFVFVFFGPVAVCGSAFVQDERVVSTAWWCAVPMGLLAVAIMLANNVRDIATDTAAGKRTLAVRLGDHGARALYVACVAASFGAVALGIVIGPLPVRSWPVLLFGGGGAVVARLALRARTAEEHVRVLGETARLMLLTGIVLALTLVER